jgi:hypothetical protein
METNGLGASFVFGKEKGWHPAGDANWFSFVTGGVALLNHRLMAGSPPGFGERWELWEEWESIGWTGDELLGSLRMG